MGLRDYFKKRRFGSTPEPGPQPAKTKPAQSHGAAKQAAGNVKRSTKPGHHLAFVVQEHHASHLHYDFRLELDGVLKSWAIPKGPSLNPHEHHLAIQTEDHPYEYRTFEGVIPEGNYGAGNVIIWDKGWYEARKGQPGEDEKTLRTELRKGHITFILHGKKLQGEFALIKLQHSDDPKAWLLVKKGDDYADTHTDVVAEQTESVKSHRQVDDLNGKQPDVSAYPKKALPWHVHPMLCTLTDEPFSRAGWLFEVKWDGYRAIASKHKDAVQLYSRNGNDFAAKYPPVAEAIHRLRHDVILDGEVVVVDQDGHAHFEWLQHWHTEPRGNLRYYVFDVLWYNGHDVRTMPLQARKQLLRHLLLKNDVVYISDDVADDGLKLFHEMQHRGLEGMVAKRADSPYREDVRGADWLKIKTHLRQEVVIGGYTEPRGSRQYLGSLLVGVYDKGDLVYVGHSGGGIPDEQRRALRDKLHKLERHTSPFAVEPKPNAPVHWVRPEMVCEMSFSEWTNDGSMRHPQFEGLREDKKPAEVHREKPKHIRPGKGIATGNNVDDTATTVTTDNAVDKRHTDPVSKSLPFEFTHLDKVFFPKHHYTKGDIIRYYETVADYILPYLADRPCSLNRMPNGIAGESFYQKNNEHLPGWVPHADIFSESNNANLRWMVGGDLNTLRYMVQLGCVEINPWNSRVGHLNKPDWLVIDLDPEGVDFKGVMQVARAVKTVCDGWRIPTHPKTSGKTGLHIYIPLHAAYTYEQSKNLGHLIALEVNKREPELTSVERLPEKRRHKIYLDFLQNREGQTLAAPYSLRPTPDATVSMPLHWDEVMPHLKPTDYTIKNALARLRHVGDLWQPVLQKGIHLPDVLAHIEATTPPADQTARSNTKK